MLTDTQVNRLAVLARKMMLNTMQAVALPAVVTRAAVHAGITEDEFVTKCFDLPELAQYVAGVCRRVTQ